MEKEAPVTGKLVFAVLTLVIGSSFHFGYNVGVPNTPGDVVQQWMNQTYAKSHENELSKNDLNLLWTVAVSMFPAGGILGGIVGSPLGARIGRKNTLYLNCCISVVGAILMGISKSVGSYYVFMVGRFVIGISGAINTAVAPQYLTEISPVRIRGIAGSLHQLFCTVGILTAEVVGLNQVLGKEALWPLVFALTGLPSIIQVVMLFFTPESPRYLCIVKRNIKAAEKALVQYRGYSDVKLELETYEHERRYMESLPKVRVKDFFTMSYLRKPLIIATVMMWSQQLSGIIATLYYSTEIFQNAGLSKDDSGYGTVGMGLAFVVFSVIATPLVDKLGRRVMYGSALGAMGVLTVLLCLTIHFQTSISWFSYLAIIFAIMFEIAFAFGPGPIPWFFVYELFLQNAVGIAASVSVAMNWTAMLVASLIWLPLQDAANEYSFLLFTGTLTFFGLFCFFYVPETKGREIEDIVASFKKSNPTVMPMEDHGQIQTKI